MKQYLVLAYSVTMIGTSPAALVFADDFSEANGTPIIGKSPDVGSAWSGSALNISNGSLDTSGNGRTLFGGFTSALATGQMITVSFDTLALGGGNFFTGGYAGVSLYTAGNERVFLGDAGGSGGNLFWAVDGGAIGLNLSSDNTQATTATFNYFYDTGAWTFTTGSGVSLSGTGAAGEAFNELRIANGSGGDIRVDNLAVDISTVPEPASLGLLVGGLGLFGLRRRR